MKLYRNLRYALCAMGMVGILSCKDDCDELYNELKSQVEDLASRVSRLENWCVSTNEQISSLQSIVDVLQNNDYVTSVDEMSDGYILHFSQSSPVIIRNGVDGNDGINGLNGLDGVDGIDGVNGLTPIIGVEYYSDGNYYWTVKYGDDDPAWLLDVEGNMIRANGEKGDKGDKGDTGETGAQGEKGDKGDTGETGATGAQGEKGDKGDKGDTGETGATGAQGEKGDKGDKGDTGETGATGAQGEKGDKGDKGDTGETGATGAQGEKGDKGDKGDTGETGATGAQGEKGDKGDKGDTGETGATGAQGEKGDKGDTGETGATGAQGEKGDKGDIGETGATGAQGEKGDKGDTGEAGHTPELSVDAYTDGNLYWKVDGEWLLYQGQMVQAAVPSYTQPVFSGIEIDKTNNEVVLTLASTGKTITLPMKTATAITFDMNEPNYVEGMGSTFTVILPSSFKETDYAGIYVNVEDNDYPYGDHTMVTRSSAGRWNPVIQKPKFDKSGNLTENLKVTLYPSTSTVYGSSLQLTVVLNLNDGSSQSASRILTNRGGRVSENTDMTGKIYIYEGSSSQLGLYNNYICEEGELLSVLQEMSDFSDVIIQGSPNEVDYQSLATYKNNFVKLTFDTPNMIKPNMQGAKNLRELYFLTGTTLNDKAFANCQSLEKVHLGNISTVGKQAFEGCIALKTVDGGQSKMYYKEASFKDCTDLYDIDLKRCTDISKEAFAGCISLSEVQFSEKTTIGESAFARCSNISSLTIPAYTMIGASAFEDCKSLNSLDVTKDHIEFGAYAFKGCSQLAALNVGAYATFDKHAFAYDDHIVEITYDEYLTIGEEAFIGSTALKTFGVPYYIISSMGKKAFASSSITAVDIYCEDPTDSAFDSCTDLTEVKIESWREIDVTKIFTNCPNIKRFTLASTTLTSLFVKSFPNVSSLTFEYNCIVEDEAFKNYPYPLTGFSSDMSYNIKIGKSAFEGCILNDVGIGECEIGEYAFKDCTIKSGVSFMNCKIGKYAFQNSSIDKNISLSTSEVDDYAFSNVSSLGCWITDSSLGSNVFENAEIHNLYAYSTNSYPYNLSCSSSTFDGFDTESCKLTLNGERTYDWLGLQWSK
jgi:hypothetical protein